MYHWLTHEPNGKVNRLLYFEGGSAVKIRDFIGSSTTTLYSLSGRGFKVAEAGTRLYVAVFNTSVAGAGDVRVVHPLLGGSPADKAFAPPLAITPVVTDPGAGNCSVGSKRFAYILETRSGYTGKPSPESGGVFFPTTFAVPSDGRQLNMQILGDTPDDAAFYHAIMTTTDNLERWFFVPDGSVAVSGGQTGWNANITIDISDVDLANNATECDANFNYLTQNELSNDPSSVVTYGRRMAYFMFNKVYISEINDFQAITEDQHAIQLPGQQELVTGFQLRGVFYLLGPNWTYGARLAITSG
jgi:hypothetical protein